MNVLIIIAIIIAIVIVAFGVAGLITGCMISSRCSRIEEKQEDLNSIRRDEGNEGIKLN